VAKYKCPSISVIACMMMACRIDVATHAPRHHASRHLTAACPTDKDTFLRSQVKQDFVMLRFPYNFPRLGTQIGIVINKIKSTVSYKIKSTVSYYNTIRYDTNINKYLRVVERVYILSFERFEHLRASAQL
jgi:hypothetical protein